MTRVAFSMELIGDDQAQHARAIRKGICPARDFNPRLFDGRSPWLARIKGLTVDGVFEREFLHPQKDYSGANSVGSRGIIAWYFLAPGIYEVNQRVNWSRWDRYFISVEDAKWRRISISEAAHAIASGL